MSKRRVSFEEVQKILETNYAFVVEHINRNEQTETYNFTHRDDVILIPYLKYDELGGFYEFYFYSEFLKSDPKSNDGIPPNDGMMGCFNYKDVNDYAYLEDGKIHLAMRPDYGVLCGTPIWFSLTPLQKVILK